MFGTPLNGERRTSEPLADLPPLEDQHSDYGPSVPESHSEEEVLTPRLIDLEAYRATGLVVPPIRGHDRPSGRPVVQWSLVIGLLSMAGLAAGLVAMAGLLIVGVIWSL